MSEPVVVDFQAQGMAAVQQAFRGIEQAALRAAKAQEQSNKKRADEANKDAKKQFDAASKYLDKQAEATKRAADKAAKDQIAAAQKAAKERERIARNEQKAQERLHRSMGGMDPASFRQRQAVLAQMKEAGVQRSIARFQANPNKGAMDVMADKVGDKFGGLLTKTGLIMGAFALLEKGVSLVTESMSQFAGFVLGDVIERFDRGKAIQQSLNTMGAGDRRKEFEQKFNQTGLDIGVDPGQVLKMFNSAAGSYGDADFSMKIATLATKFEKGYGAGGEAFAEILAKQVKAADGKMSDEDLAMRAAIIEERVGQKDSTLSPKMLGAKWAQFEGVTSQLGGSASANMMHATGVANFAGRTMNDKKLFPALEAFIASTSANINQGNTGPTKQIEDLPAALADAVIKAKGDERAAKAMGYSDSAIDFMRPFLKAFREADGDKNKAITDLITSVAGPGGANVNSLDSMVKSVDETPAAKLERMMLRVKDALEPIAVVAAEKVVPALEKITPEAVEALEAAIDDLADYLDSLADQFDKIGPALSLFGTALDYVKAAAMNLLSPFSLVGGGIMKLLAKIAPFIGMKDQAAGFAAAGDAMMAQAKKTTIGKIAGAAGIIDASETGNGEDGPAGGKLSRRDKRLGAQRADALDKQAGADAAAAEAARRKVNDDLAKAAADIAKAAETLAKVEPPSTPLSDPARKP
jgi:hypothetical protein